MNRERQRRKRRPTSCRARKRVKLGDSPSLGQASAFAITLKLSATLPTGFVVRFPAIPNGEVVDREVRLRPHAVNNRVVTAKRQTLERESTKAHGRKQDADIHRRRCP